MPFQSARHHIKSLRHSAGISHRLTTACAAGATVALGAAGVALWRGSLPMAGLSGLLAAAAVVMGLATIEHRDRLLESAGLIERTGAV